MLVLSRKKGETIVIKNRQTGGVIRIVVAKICGNVVRIGIEASESDTVLREEIIERTKKQK